MSQSKPFSKLKKQIEQLFTPELNLQIQCFAYPIKSQYGSSSIPRFYISFNKNIVWDFPKDFPIKYINYHYWKSDTHISDLIRNYIDASIEGLLEKTFANEQINLEHCFPNEVEFLKTKPMKWDAESDPNYTIIKYDFNLGLTDIFKAADRRLGKDKLLQWAKEKNNPLIQSIIDSRFKINIDQDKKPFNLEAQRMQELKKIHEGLSLIKTPLDPSDVRHLCRCIFRKQITIDMLTKEVYDGLKETDLYKDFLKSNFTD